MEVKQIPIGEIVPYERNAKKHPEEQVTQIARSSSNTASMFKGMTMKEFLRYLWNAPRRGQSPYKIFERVLIPDGYDENGDIVYRYNNDVTFEKNGEMNVEDIDRMDI